MTSINCRVRPLWQHKRDPCGPRGTLSLTCLCYTTLIFFLESSFVILDYVYTYIMETSWNLSFYWEITCVNYCRYTKLCQQLMNGGAEQQQACNCWLIWCERHSAAGQYVSETRTSHLDDCVMASCILTLNLSLENGGCCNIIRAVIDIRHAPRKCDGWGCLLLASHHTGPGSNSGHSTWDVLWQKWWRDRFFSEYFSFFFNPMPPHVPYGLCGLPSRLWLKCSRLLRLGRPWGAVTLSQWGGWWYMDMEYQVEP
jgi:hypothetical protein